LLVLDQKFVLCPVDSDIRLIYVSFISKGEMP
jgi:hypothetical protein